MVSKTSQYRYGLRRQLLLNLGLVVLVVWGVLSLVLTRTAYLQFMQERLRYVLALSEQIDHIVALQYWRGHQQGGAQVWFEGRNLRRNAVLWPTQGMFVFPDGRVLPLFGVQPADILLRIRIWMKSEEQFKLHHSSRNGKIFWERYRRIKWDNRELGVLWLSWEISAIRGAFFTYQGLLFLSLLLFGFLVLFLSMSFLERRLIDPLGRLGDAMASLAMGEKGGEIEKELGRRDQIGDLARGFVEMERILQHQAKERERHIEELASAKDALERAQEELVLREKMATVGRLAAGVAHEVGNPLSAIMGYSDLLRGTEQWSEMEEDLVKRINKEAHRIDRIIRDLLDYARPVERESPGYPLSAIRDALDLLRLQVRFKRMEVIRELPEHLPQVQMSENILIQVLINILSNAADACEGKGQIVIRAALDAETSAVSIDILDNGPGIAEEIRERLFEPFATTKEPGQGVGLGLALCHRMVKESGGNITLLDGQEQGAHFHITLPLVSESSEENGEEN